MKTLNTVNVIEFTTDNTCCQSCRSFTDDKEGNEAAEGLFRKLVTENADEECTDEAMDVYIEDGYFETGTYYVCICHSCDDVTV